MNIFSSPKKTRYAVVGTGWFAQAAVLPGFANAKHAALAAVVSGDPEKRDALGKKYGVPAYTYEQYDGLLASGAVDAVYIVLPNAMHKDYTLRAAGHKVHVLCEKPLAVDAAECREMIAACTAAGVKLMTAYRLHLEHATLAAVEAVKTGKIGDPRLVVAVNTQMVVDNSTRLDGDLAGGPLMDMGVYCVNAARYLFQADPTEVTGSESYGTDPKHKEVPEAVSAVLKFPGGRQAVVTCGFNHGKTSQFRVMGTAGSVALDPAFSFTGKKVLTVESLDGDPADKTFADTDHVGAEIEYFADCIQNDKEVEPDGREGLADLMIIDAIRESCRTGRAVKVGPFDAKPRPDESLQRELPQVTQPKLVNAQSPGG